MNQEHETEQPTTTEPTTEVRAKRPRGFAAMSAEQRSAISRKGGKAAHEAGTAHRFTSDEAKREGRKGGLARKRARGGEGDAR